MIIVTQNVEDNNMKQDKIKYEKPQMDVVLLETDSQLLQSSQTSLPEDPDPLPVDPELNPFQW